MWNVDKINTYLFFGICVVAVKETNTMYFCAQGKLGLKNTKLNVHMEIKIYIYIYVF